MKSPLTKLARQLRKDATDAERLVWKYLRARQLNNVKFRRQQPIGPFIVDFVCFEKKLIIEIDGGHHSENEEINLRRTEWLRAKGYRVIRFWNNEVLQNSRGVFEEILKYCS